MHPLVLGKYCYRRYHQQFVYLQSDLYPNYFLMDSLRLLSPHHFLRCWHYLPLLLLQRRVHGSQDPFHHGEDR